MRIRLILLCAGLIYSNLFAQKQQQYILGGDISGELEQSDHGKENYGNLLDFELNIDIKVAKSFGRPKDHNKTKKLPSKIIFRVYHFYRGIDIAINHFESHSDFYNLRQYSFGPYFFLKYYTPIYVFFESSIGVDYIKRMIWENVPSQQTLYIPKKTIIGFGFEFTAGYSINLKYKCLFEPSISYKIQRNKTTITGNPSEEFNLVKNSFNVNIGFYFLIDRLR